MQAPRAAAVAAGVGNVKRMLDLYCGARATDVTREAVCAERGLEDPGTLVRHFEVYTSLYPRPLPVPYI